ncbi:hypothetical protein [Aliikangiella sp. G2MR2-5]|uniref:hypothetical protein n=1 Tax=Aliikangiella sp. G2MR2-5 TaxID=2788943 RepID=UPI0018AC1D20|nr:hypothetical protein [Aliikangiella sp. G2MR2-5]
MNGEKLSLALRRMFAQSLTVSLNDIFADDDIKVVPIDGLGSVDTSDAIFLTISSHQFRVFVIVHFSKEQEKEFYAITSGSQKEQDDSAAVTDYLLEFGNNLCGVLKRELGKFVPALGMSTPNMLSRSSIELLKEFEIFDSEFKQVEYHDKPIMCVSYHFLPNDNNDIEIELIQEEIADSGELELF